MNIKEYMRLPLEERLEKSGTQKINSITIDGNTFTGYKAFSFFYEKTYPKSPERSQGGVIDLSSHSFFLTPHLKIDYSMISYDDWRRMTRLILSKNEFVVQCCDLIFGGLNDESTFKMYFAPDQLPKLQTMARTFNGERWTEIIGILDYTVELIGTNAALDTATVTYHLNPPKESGMSDVVSSKGGIVVGSEFVVKDSLSDTKISGYKFKCWRTSPDTTVDSVEYANNSVTIMPSLSGFAMYAVWENSNVFTLSYSYGLGDAIMGADGKIVRNKTINKGEPIGALPDSIQVPSVIYRGHNYVDEESPYVRDGWYQTSFKGDNSTKLTADTPFWAEHDVIIYQLFGIKSYKLTFNSNGGQDIPAMTVRYGDVVALPRVTKSGEIFKEWCIDSELKIPFSGIMPPTDLILYAKWRENK